MKLNSLFKPRSCCYTQSEMTEEGEGHASGYSDGYGCNSGFSKNDDIWEEERTNTVCGAGNGISDGACCVLGTNRYGGLGRGTGDGRGDFEGRGETPQHNPF